MHLNQLYVFEFFDIQSFAKFVHFEGKKYLDRIMNKKKWMHLYQLYVFEFFDIQALAKLAHFDGKKYSYRIMNIYLYVYESKGLILYT